MMLVTIIFADNYLNGQVAQNDFSSMSQFMQTLGLQVDDVAWIPGRTQTLTYASKYGATTFRYPALTYSFYFNGQTVASFPVGVIMFEIPTSEYTVFNNYTEEIFPASTNFLQNGTLAPICRVFVIEQVPMPDGDYIRIVCAPIVRQLNAVINTTNYDRFYLPILTEGSAPQSVQSVTLTGMNVYHQISTGVNNVTITVAFPNSTQMGLTSSFFNFAATSQTIILGSNTVVEIYGGNETVSLGVSS
jgi:hypothetical protein